MSLDDKTKEFFKTSMQFFGKEIEVPSGQYFCIDRIIDPDDLSKIYMQIQYGFSQSGCVNMGCELDQKNMAARIKEFTIYAPPEGEDIVMINYTPEVDFWDVGITMDVGLNTGAIKHSTSEEILRNPNAIRMLDTAINDISKAQIIGECKADVVEGSLRIPCCESKRRPKEPRF